MIVRAKTPKGLSWAGRIAVLGMAALLLPLAPSWAQDDAEQRVAEKLQNDPELSAIASQIKTTTEQLRQNSGNRGNLIKKPGATAFEHRQRDRPYEIEVEGVGQEWSCDAARVPRPVGSRQAAFQNHA